VDGLTDAKTKWAILGLTAQSAISWAGRTGAKKGKWDSMVRLKKYIEWMSRGRRTNRIAYVMKEWDLPTPLPGAEWHIDQKFSVADELLRDPELKIVFKAALEKGHEVITRRE